jgi:hypothetical protein
MRSLHSQNIIGISNIVLTKKDGFESSLNRNRSIIFL